jgi:hypothetical protein
MAGDQKGKRTLADEDDVAKELFGALDDDQKKVALQKEQFPEVAGKTPGPSIGEPKGVAAAAMTDKQRAILVKMLKLYTERRMSPDIAKVTMDQVMEAGLGKVHFAYAGGTEQGKPHTYRVQGPTFVIEFLNIQADSANNPANHIHSVWRNIRGDFGESAKK